MFHPGGCEKPDLKAEYLDFWIAANSLNSIHAPEVFFLKVAQEEQKCDEPWLWRGKQEKELWVLCCIRLHRSYFLVKKNSFPNNLLKTGVWSWALLAS